jgi:hypothetical protein
MPGTLMASVSDSFRKDHNNIPFLNIPYDGQDTSHLRQGCRPSSSRSGSMLRLTNQCHLINEITCSGKLVNNKERIPDIEADIPALLRIVHHV